MFDFIINLFLNIFYFFSSSRRSIRMFRNSKKGTCVIVGNGPSLNKTNFDLVTQFDSFGLNRIHLFFPKTSWRPTYLVAVNHLVLKQMNEEELLRDSTFVTYSFKIKTFFKGKGVGMNHRQLKPVKPFHKDLSKGIEIGSTVTFVAMQLAFYMGYDTILLVGVDHSFIQKGRPNEKQTLEGPDMNHFTESYFKGQEWQLADLENSEVHYRLAKEWALANNRNIYDCTVGGRLNVFQKGKLEDFV